ncbi:MAG: hypothetical protein DMG21_16630, partial [Acidobacteria bacterium]
MSFWDWLLRRRQHEADLDEEIQAHLVMAAQERVKQSEPAPEALTSATREFGNVALVKEVTREMWGFAWLETWLQDIRYGLRQLRRNPGFAAVAVITLGLGIGVNTTIFSFVQAFLLRRPPVSDPDRVVMLCSTNPKGGFWMPDKIPVSAPDFLDWRKQATSYSGMAAAAFASFTVS